MSFPEPVAQRGVNPIPESGWPWYLTEYEVAYVRRFNVRPVREAWNETPEENARLDMEAEGIRSEAKLEPALRDGPRNRHHAATSWIVIGALAALLVGVGVTATALGVVNLNEAAQHLRHADEVRPK